MTRVILHVKFEQHSTELCQQALDS